MKAWTILTLCVVLGHSTSSLADATETGKVNKIKINSNQTISIYLDGPNDTTDCSGGKQWIINTATDQLANEKYSAVLSAANARSTITLVHSSSAGCGAWSSNQVYDLTVSYSQ